jgi:hypothetical protein
MAKESLDSDRLNYLVWRYVSPLVIFCRPSGRAQVRYRRHTIFANAKSFWCRYLVESGM